MKRSEYHRRLRVNAIACDVQTLIDQLGLLKPREIVALFKAEGITGTSGAHNCPVANYLNKHLGISESGVLERSYVSQSAVFVVCEDDTVELSVPTSVRQFITNFDGRKVGYEDLHQTVVYGY